MRGDEARIVEVFSNYLEATAALRVSPRVRAMLRIEVYAISDGGDVRGPIADP
jgi:hypothetical protein